jgi:hypothetical protein
MMKPPTPSVFPFCRFASCCSCAMSATSFARSSPTWAIWSIAAWRASFVSFWSPSPFCTRIHVTTIGAARKAAVAAAENTLPALRPAALTDATNDGEPVRAVHAPRIAVTSGSTAAADAA